MENYRANSMQQYVEKGLQSQNLADVLTTITECARYIREYPFPNFVHNTLFRLAQAFHGEIFGRKFEHSMNTIRLRIVTAIRECSGSLSLTFSLSEEMVRIIMKVSHSNDYKTRSLTLLLLASLAPLIYEDKKVHNLVIESLDCTEHIELTAAIHAANELAKHSISFSALIVRKIAEMFGQSQLSNSIKIDLIAVISNLRDLTVSKSCIELGRALLNTTDDKMHAAVYYSLTQLAARNAEAVLHEQIALLLSELHKNIAQKNKLLVHCILQNLSDIAAHQQQWMPERVKEIRDFFPQIMSLSSKGILCTWLHCLDVLSSTGQHSPILIETTPWNSLLASPVIVVRIFAIKLSLILLQTGEICDQFRDELFNSILCTLRHFIAHPQCTSPIVGRHRLEFLTLVSNFVRSPKCKSTFAISICQYILGAKLIGPCRDLFELLAAISDTYWADCREIVSSTLFNKMEVIQNLAEIPSIAFTILLSTTPTTLFENVDNNQKLATLTNRLLSHSEFDHWSLYLIARSALRYGHWRLVSLPLLERIRKSCENMETESWILGLIHICKGQPTAFSVDELNHYESELQFAALNFKLLGSTEKSQPFAFAADYANCLQSTYRGMRSLLITINVKLLTLGATMDGTTSEFQRKSIVQSLSLIRNSIVEARQQWVALCSKSFDADTQTLLLAGLMIRMCLLLEQFLHILCEPRKEQKLSDIPIEDLGESTKNNFRPSAQTRTFHSLLNWARNELLEFHSSEADLILNLQMLTQVLRHLAAFPVGLPRFFFQRVQSTRIKLIISPQPPSSDGKAVFRVASTELLPLVVEGIIESNNPKAIESVCVVLTLKRDNTAATEKKQTVQLEQGQKYFRAQFLLKIHQKTKISAKVWFVDAVTKKQWFDESDTVALTVELMDGAA